MPNNNVQTGLGNLPANILAIIARGHLPKVNMASMVKAYPRGNVPKTMSQTKNNRNRRIQELVGTLRVARRFLGRMTKPPEGRRYHPASTAIIYAALQAHEAQTGHNMKLQKKRLYNFNFGPNAPTDPYGGGVYHQIGNWIIQATGPYNNKGRPRHINLTNARNGQAYRYTRTS